MYVTLPDAVAFACDDQGIEDNHTDIFCIKELDEDCECDEKVVWKIDPSVFTKMEDSSALGRIIDVVSRTFWVVGATIFVNDDALLILYVGRPYVIDEDRIYEFLYSLPAYTFERFTPYNTLPGAEDCFAWTGLSRQEDAFCVPILNEFSDHEHEEA